MTPAQRKLTAENLLGMLEKGSIAASCPFAKGYWYCDGHNLDCSSIECGLCHEATGLKEYDRCPCYTLTYSEAVRRAWLFVKESGILEVQDA